MPQKVLLRIGQVLVGHMYREVIAWSQVDELLLPFRHLVAVPAPHAILIYRQGLVWNHKVLAYAHHLAESLACGACAVGIVEVEHQVRRFAEFHAVGHKLARE